MGGPHGTGAPPNVPDKSPITVAGRAAFPDGYDDSGSRERGTRILLEQLGGELQR